MAERRKEDREWTALIQELEGRLWLPRETASDDARLSVHIRDSREKGARSAEGGDTLRLPDEGERVLGSLGVRDLESNRVFGDERRTHAFAMRAVDDATLPDSGGDGVGPAPELHRVGEEHIDSDRERVDQDHREDQKRHPLDPLVVGNRLVESVDLLGQLEAAEAPAPECRDHGA